jgi:hypothetical protein
MESVHQALLQCPNITSLDLRVSLLGCSEWPDRFNFPFTLSGGELYPSLKEVRLEGYDFDERPWEKSQLKNTRKYSTRSWWPGQVLSWWRSGKMQQYLDYRNLEEGQRVKTNLELWVDAMDWGRVEVLGLRDCRGQSHFMESMAPRLQSLKSLEIWDGWQRANNTLRFIQSLEPGMLTNLTWRSGWTTDILSPILQRHNNSLRSLEIRTGEEPSDPTNTFSASQLQQLVHSTPRLERLGINIHRNGSWPYDVFATIAQAKQLRAVDMWFDILSDCERQKPERWTRQYHAWERDNENNTFKCEGENRYQRPFVDENSALEIFRYMRKKNTSGHLKEVVFWVGNWSRSWDGPIHFESPLERKRAKVVCTLEGKNEGEAWCIVEEGESYWKGDESREWMY